MTVRDRTRYESLPRDRGIVRVHTPRCKYLLGRRCNCTPSYRAEAWDNVVQRRKYATHRTIEGARRWRDDARTQIKAGLVRATAAPTLADAYQEWKAAVEAGTVRSKDGERFKPAVWRAYESKFRLYILPRFGRVRVNELRLVHVQAWVHELQEQGQAARTVRNAVMPLRTFYRWARLREYVTVHPCDGLELPTGEQARERVATVAEAVRLIAAVPERDKAIWATACFAGLRRGELMALDWSAVDLAGARLRVCRSYDPGSQTYGAPKTKKGTRTVILPELLIPHLARLDRVEGLVFGPTGTTPFNDGDLRERARKAWTAASMEPIGIHECRHTYASLMIAAGVNIKTISECMGHASVQITLDRYGHLLDGALDDVKRTFDNYLASNVG